MRKITFFLALMVAMVTTASAQFTQTIADIVGEVAPLQDVPAEVTANHSSSDGYVADACVIKSYSCDVTVENAGDVTVNFKYTGGAHGLVILGVDMLDANGEVLYSEYANGRTPVKNGSKETYTLSNVAAGNYELRYIFCHRGSDHEVGNQSATITVTNATYKVVLPEGVIADPSEISSTGVYTIVPQEANRGALKAAATDTYLETAQSNPSSADQHFMFVEHNDKMYLYSVAAGKFVNDEGKYLPLVAEPDHFITVEKAATGYMFILMNGVDKINVSNGWDHGTLADWNTADGGNTLRVTYIEEASQATLDAIDAILNPETPVEPDPEVTIEIDATKKYYLETLCGTNKGYLALGGKSGGNYGDAYLTETKEQVFTFTLVEEGANKYYTLSTEVANATGKEVKYVNCDHAYNVSGGTASNLLLEMENATSTKYIIKTSKGYMKSEQIYYDTTNSGYHIFSNEANATNACAWKLVEYVETPEVPEEPKGDIDVTKEYYLEAEYMAGMSAAKGYITIDGMQNQVYIASEKKQAFKFELVENGTDIFYTLSTEVSVGTGSSTLYLNCDAAAVMGNATNASPLFFEKENATSDKYYVKSGNAYLRAGNNAEWVGTNQAYIVYNEECDPYFRIKFTLVADGEEPTPEVPEVTADPLVLVSEPANVEKISKIELEFDREVASVDANARFKLLKRDESIAQQFMGNEGMCSGNKVTFYLMSPISESGTFTFVIPADAIVAADGGKVAETSYKITVVAAPKPSQTTYNVDNSLSTLTIAFSEEIEFVAEHTVEKLEVKAGNDVVAEIPVANIAIEAKNLTLTLDEAIAPEGTTQYTIAIPANFITKKGATLQYAGGTIKVTVKIPFALKGITPVSGSTVEAFEKIVAEYNGAINFYPNAVSFKLVNIADNSEIALTATKDGKVVTFATDAEVPNGTYKLANLNYVVDNSTFLAPTTLSEYTITVAGAEEVTPLAATFEPDYYAYTYEEDGSVTAAEGFNAFKLLFNERLAKPYDGMTAAEVRALGLEWVKDGEGNVVAIDRISVDALGGLTIEVTPYVETSGVYTLTIPADIIKNYDGSKSYEGGSFVITIPGSETPTLPEYQLYVLDANMEPSALEGPVASVQNFVFAFDGAKIQLAEAPTAGIFNPTTSSYVAEGTVVADEAMFGMPILGVMFNEPFAEVGSYFLHIPAGTFAVGEVIYTEDIYVPFTIAGSETPEAPALTIESVTPEEGEVESISEIIITFSDMIDETSCSEIYLTDAKWNMIELKYQFDESLSTKQMKFVAEKPITAAGEYTLDGTSVWVMDINGKAIQGFNQSFTWIIKAADTAIDGVDAEAENAEIYDLTGRRVKEITKGGIYIINGKKAMVK